MVDTSSRSAWARGSVGSIRRQEPQRQLLPPAPHSVSDSLGLEWATLGVAPCWNKTVNLKQSRQRWPAKPLAWQAFWPEGTSTSPPSQDHGRRLRWHCPPGPGSPAASSSEGRQRHGQREALRPWSHSWSMAEPTPWTSGVLASGAALMLCCWRKAVAEGLPDWPSGCQVDSCISCCWGRLLVFHTSNQVGLMLLVYDRKGSRVMWETDRRPGLQLSTPGSLPCLCV